MCIPVACSIRQLFFVYMKQINVRKFVMNIVDNELFINFSLQICPFHICQLKNDFAFFGFLDFWFEKLWIFLNLCEYNLVLMDANYVAIWTFCIKKKSVKENIWCMQYLFVAILNFSRLGIFYIQKYELCKVFTNRTPSKNHILNQCAFIIKKLIFLTHHIKKWAMFEL